LLNTAVSIFSVLFQILEPVLWQHILKHSTPLLLIRLKTMLHIYHYIVPPFSPSYSYPYSSAWFSPIFQWNFDFSTPEDKINVWLETSATKHPVTLRGIAERRRPHLHH
jgi:hypothetical protein